MKKTLLLALLALMASTISAQNDTTSNKNQYYQPAQRTAPRTSSAGICKDMTGTLVSIGGYAPYKQQPEQKPDKAFWPRFSVDVSGGYAYRFFTFEGVVEYMQANINPVGEKANYYNYIMTSGRVGIMVPVDLGGTVMLVPNVKGMFGGAFYIGSGISSRFAAGVSGGLDIGFKIGSSNMLSLGYVYQYRWFINGSTNINLGMMGGHIAFIF